MQQRVVTVNGIEFAYLEAGPPAGPLALCLHGFPDTAHTWRHLLPALAEAGYHAVAPWMRGYAPTAVPADGVYQVGALAVRRLRACTRPSGATTGPCSSATTGAPTPAYGAASLHPDRWRRVVTMAVPPLAASAASFFTYAQLKRSFYIFFFQTPLAEMAVSADGHEFLDRLWADWSPGYDASWDLARVKESIGDPANLVGRHRLLPGRVRPHPPQPPPTTRPRRRRRRCPPSPPVPPRRRRRLHGPRRHRRRALGAVGGLRVRGRRRRRALPPPRAARGRRAHVMRFLDA